MNEHLAKMQSDLLDDQVFYTRMMHLHQTAARAWLVATLCFFPASALALFGLWLPFYVLFVIGAAGSFVGKFIGWRANQFEKTYQVKVPLDV